MFQEQQSMRSPLAPQTTLSTDERLALYNAKYQHKQEQSEAEQQSDPFEPSVNQDPQDRQADMEKWLDPVAVDTSTPSVMGGDRTSPHYKHFEEKFMNDPAIQEIAPMMMGDDQNPGLAVILGQAIQNGEMTYDEAMDQATTLMDKYIVPILDKHHSDKSKERDFIHPDVKKLFGINKQKAPSGAKTSADLAFGGE